MTWWAVYTETLEECKKVRGKKKSHLTKSGSNWQVSLLLSFMFIHATRQVRIRKISPFPLSPFLESEQILYPPFVFCRLSCATSAFVFTSDATASFVFFLLEGQKQTQPAAYLAFHNNWFGVSPWSVGIFFFDTAMLILMFLCCVFLFFFLCSP